MSIKSFVKNNPSIKKKPNTGKKIFIPLEKKIKCHHDDCQGRCI